MPPRILSISFSNIASDSRVLRQLKVLAEFGDVTTVGFGRNPGQVVEHIQLPEGSSSLPKTFSGVVKLAFRMHGSVELKAPAERATLRAVGDREFDLVVANEARALPVALAIAKGAPVWGDMHEWAPEERTHVFLWRVLVAPYMRHICEKFLGQTAAVSTISDSLAKLYRDQFGVDPVVVRNSSEYRDLLPSPVDPRNIRLVHSGGAVPGRNIEALIDATIAAGEKFSLHLYLVTAGDGGKYLSALKRRAEESPRVFLHPPVSPSELPVVLNQYDVGVFLLPPINPNAELMLPNKFFDFVQARLALLFGPSIEIESRIRQFDLGLVTDDFSTESLVNALNALDAAQITSFKQNASRRARELSYSVDGEVERRLIKRILEPLEVSN
ncbi:MAG: hypothetical protein KF772_02060 [Cryobacterium sp.]|nr:hypothetical protein [Cryobacterium sp.]